MTSRPVVREDRVARLELSDFDLHGILLRLADVGRVGNHDVERGRRESVEQSAWWNSIREVSFVAAALARATSRALAEMSEAWISADGSSLARASAMAPEPVPRSTILSLCVTGRSLPKRSRRAPSIVFHQFNTVSTMCSVSGRGLERRAKRSDRVPELLMSSDVLSRNSVDRRAMASS